MKDILFLIPLYYTAHGIERFHAYLKESGTRHTSDVFVSCSNPAIAKAASAKAAEYGFMFQERKNYGGGEGALWHLQQTSGVDLSAYRYTWYFEESCEPIRKGWIERLLCDMENGAALSGWDWIGEGRKRPGAIRRELRDRCGNLAVAYENTDEGGADPYGNSMNKIWDTPGYRDETFVIRSEDFLSFLYPNASHPFWKKFGVRGYGIRAERMWWDMEEQNIHGMEFPSPNVQWHTLKSGRLIPTKNRNFWYFRELPYETRLNASYAPPPFFFRRVWQAINLLRVKIKTLVMPDKSS